MGISRRGEEYALAAVLLVNNKKILFMRPFSPFMGLFFSMWRIFFYGTFSPFGEPFWGAFYFRLADGPT